MNFDYNHGANIYIYDNYNDLLDFSSNINPLGLPKILDENINLYQSKYARYPDSLNLELIEHLALYESIKPEYLYIGNGASDIIYRVVSALKPKQALLLAPTFSEYEKALKAHSSKIDYYYLKTENDFKLDNDFINYLTNDIDLIFICNPNNPTGSLIELDLLVMILDKCKALNIKVVLDECFIDFVLDSNLYTTKNIIEQYPNLLVLKAFTKTFALAGFRLGYALSSNKTLLNDLAFYGPDWPISTIAQEVGIKVLQDKTYLNNSIQVINKQRDYLNLELTKLGFKVFDSSSNFIFFQCDNHIDLKQLLLQKKILIRSCENFRGLDNTYYRICIMQKPENDILTNALKKVMNNG